MNTLNSFEYRNNQILVEKLITHYMALSKREKISFSLSSYVLTCEEYLFESESKNFFGELESATRDIDLVYQVSKNQCIAIMPELLSEDTGSIIARLNYMLKENNSIETIEYRYAFFEYNNENTTARELIKKVSCLHHLSNRECSHAI